MSDDSTIRVTIRLSQTSEGQIGPDELETLALRLRQELLDLGADRVERVSVGPAPPGARGIDLVGIVQLVATVLGTVATVAQLIDFIERWRNRQERGEAVQVEVEEREPGAARPATGRSALIVANAVYDDRALSQLRSPTHDADALARVLGDPAIGGFDVDLLTDADERTVRRRVAEFFAGRDRDDVLLLHFSCHGLKDARGRLHLAARDTELRRIAATAVPASLVSDLMDETASARVILILDCCYSGAFARGTRVRADRDVHLADAFGAGAGRTILTATNATEYAFDGGTLSDSDASPSVFTGALVEGMATGEADLNADGDISVDELFEYAHRQVGLRTPGQAPRKWSFDVAGSLVVARSPRPASLPEQVRADLVSERVVLRLEAVAALRDLLTGPRAGLREIARAELRRLHERDDSRRVRDAAGLAMGSSSLVGPVVPEPVPAVGRPVARDTAAPTPATAPATAPQSAAAAPTPTATPQFAAAATGPTAVPTPTAAASGPADPAPAPADSEPTPRVRGVSHPALLAVLVLATAVSLVQFAQMANELNVRLSTDLSGLAFFAVVPIVAAIGLVASLRQSAGPVTSLRRSARNWSIGMTAVLILSIGVFSTMEVEINASPFGPLGFSTDGPSDPAGVGVFAVDLALRYLVMAVGPFWYALRGPRWRLGGLPTWGSHPGLLLAAVVGAALSLIGALGLSASTADGNHAVFNLFKSARLGQAYGAVVGIGNVWRAEPNALDPAAAIWDLGWLVLSATAVAGALSALLHRRRRAAAGILVSLAVSIVIGLAATGRHEGQAGVRALGLALAAMTVTAASGVLWYAWRGAR